MRQFLDAVALMERAPLPQSVITAAVDRVMGEIGNYSLDSFFSQSGAPDDDIRDWFVELAYDAENKISRRFQGNVLPLYREIVAPTDWDYEAEIRPQIYWAYDANAAHAHFADDDADGVRWLLISQVTDQQIDWVETLARGANVQLEPECEIVLNKGVVPEIMSAKIRAADFRNTYF